MNVAKVLRFTPMEQVFKIILPVAVPYIFTGMRLSLGIAWIVIVAAEMLTGGIGIGLMWLHLFILRTFSNSEIKYQYE